MSEVEPNDELDVTVGEETESPRGWSYAVSVSLKGEGESTHEVTLSHHDYEHWCGGIEPPSRVVSRALRLAIQVMGDTLPPRFDLTQLRRRIERFDERMRQG